MLQLPPLSLYVHIPWCIEKCPYCDFNSHKLRGEIPETEYLNALIDDLKKSHCNIRGIDKPRIFLEEGNFYASFWDNTIMYHVGSEFDEFFFITPDMPELHIKQCHLVKNYIEFTYPKMSSLKKLYDFSQESLNELNGICRYPLYKTMTCGKLKGLLTPKCMFVLEEAKKNCPAIYNIYSDFIKQQGQIYPERYNDGDILKSFVGVRSKSYFMGQQNQEPQPNKEMNWLKRLRLSY